MVAALEGPVGAESQTYAGVVSFPRGVAVFSERGGTRVVIRLAGALLCPVAGPGGG